LSSISSSDDPTWLRRALTVLLGAVAVVGLVELVARAVVMPDWRAVQPVFQGQNPLLGTGVMPGLHLHHVSPGNWDVTVNTNSLGFRGTDADLDCCLDGGIWMLGDSDTFGFGVEDNQTLAALLTAAGLPAANLGQVGNQLPRIGTYLTRLKDHRPRMIVYVLTLNDSMVDPSSLSTDEPPPAQPDPGAAGMAATNAAMLVRPELLSLATVKEAMLGNSAAYVAAKALLLEIPGMQAQLVRWGRVADPDLIDSGDAFMIRKDQADRVRQRAAGIAAYLSSVQRTVRQDFGVPLAIVLLPSVHQLYPDRFARYVAFRHLDAGAFDPDQPRTAMRDALLAAKIPVLDATQALAATGDPHLYFPWNSHFSLAGNQAIARALAAWIPGLTP
jgi:hypothetical protein